MKMKYVSGDDVAASNLEFLKMVRDRISEDIAGRSASSPSTVIKLLAEARSMLLDLCDGYPDHELHRSPSEWAKEAKEELERHGWDVKDQEDEK